MAIDIGFVGNKLDISTLLAFVGSGDGYVTTWYNQGSLGSAADLVQSIANQQPVIVSAGSVLIATNGKPGIFFSDQDGAWQSLHTSGSNFISISTDGNEFMNAVTYFQAKPDANSRGWGMFAFSANATNNNNFTFWVSGVNRLAVIQTQSTNGQDSNQQLFAGSSYPDGFVPNVYSSQNKFLNNLSIWKNGALVNQAAATYTASGTPQPGQLFVGTLAYAGGVSSYGFMVEAICDGKYWSDADRHTLERNQGALYGISVS